jgi:hypothetical protein
MRIKNSRNSLRGEAIDVLVSIKVSQSVKDWLDAEADKQGIPVGTLIRNILLDKMDKVISNHPPYVTFTPYTTNSQ